MGSDHGHDHGHDHEHGASSHDHAHDHAHGGHGDDHGHHGGEEFVPTSSVHDKFLLLCATICALGFVYLGYFWMTALPLAAVTEHGAESAHQEMLDEAGLGKGSEHGAEHATEAPKTDSAAPHGETTATPAAPATEGGEHGASSESAKAEEPTKSDVTPGGPPASTTGSETKTTETAPGTSTGTGEGH